MFPRQAVNLDNSLDGSTPSEKVRSCDAVVLGCDGIKFCGGWTVEFQIRSVFARFASFSRV